MAEQAYKAGASRVIVTLDDPRVRRAALLHGPDEALTTAYDWELAQVRSWVSDSFALIRLTGNADPHVFDDVDPAWAGPSRSSAGRTSTGSGTPSPSRCGWTDDVVAEWRAHADLLGRRAAALTEFELDAVRYHGGGTDLTAGLPSGAVWGGGGLTTERGVAYLPNLPTEEVFNSPDRRRADGVIRTTRPLVLPGQGCS